MIALRGRRGRASSGAFLFMRAAKRPCTYPGCGVLTDGGRCDKHKREEQRSLDHRRGSAAARGYGRTWQKASKAFLRAHPLCQCPDCDEGRKRLRPSDVVDHIEPHRGDMALFWNRGNWQAMNKLCHDAKTAREDGGFGNRGRAGQFSDA